MATAFYTKYKVAAMQAGPNLATDTIKGMLMKSTYVPNIDTDTFVSDIIANESSGTGYTTGGKQITTPVVTLDATNHRAVFGGDNLAWPGTTISDARYLAIYKSTGSNATSQLIALVDFGSTQSTSGDTFQVTWAAAGIAALT